MAIPGTKERRVSSMSLPHQLPFPWVCSWLWEWAVSWLLNEEQEAVNSDTKDIRSKESSHPRHGMILTPTPVCVCLCGGGVSPHYQAILEDQLGVLQFNSILPLSTRLFSLRKFQGFLRLCARNRDKDKILIYYKAQYHIWTCWKSRESLKHQGQGQTAKQNLKPEV